MQEAGMYGMSEREFRCTTPRFFVNRRKGYEKTERAQWERTRIIAYYAFMSYPKKSPPTVKKFMPFEWDKSRLIENPFKSAEEWKAAFADFANALNDPNRVWTEV